MPFWLRVPLGHENHIFLLLFWHFHTHFWYFFAFKKNLKLLASSGHFMGFFFTSWHFKALFATLLNFFIFWHFPPLCFNTFGHFFAPSGTTVLFPMSIRYRSLLLVCTQRARTLSINCTFSYADLQWGPFCYYEPQRAGSLSLNDPFFPMSIQYGVPFTCMHPESLNSGL